MNPGGIRANLTFASATVGEGDGVVTFGEALAVQPFNNLVVTQDMTGDQIKAVLEQQWAACTPPGRSGGATVILQVSATFTYSFTGSFQGADRSGGPTAAGLYREDVVFTDSGGAHRCTSNDQPWVATQ